MKKLTKKVQKNQIKKPENKKNTNINKLKNFIEDTLFEYLSLFKAEVLYSMENNVQKIYEDIMKISKKRINKISFEKTSVKKMEKKNGK